MKIVIPGPPIAKCRPKFSRRSSYVQTYDPQGKLMGELRTLLRWEMEKIDLKAPLSSQLSVSFSFHLPIADSLTEAKRNTKAWNLDGFHKPDLDNLIKIWDFANGILWIDDSQIVQLTAEKKYSENPCTIIEIIPIDIHMDKQTQAIIKLFSPDEMYQFRCDASLLANSIEEMKAAMVDDQALFLPPVAKQIIDFSKKYSKKLSKLAKENGS